MFVELRVRRRRRGTVELGSRVFLRLRRAEQRICLCVAPTDMRRSWRRWRATIWARIYRRVTPVYERPGELSLTR